MLRFLIKITWFLSFSNKNDAESFRNFIKNQILNPKHAKFNQNSSFGHLRAVGGGRRAVGGRRRSPGGRRRSAAGGYGSASQQWRRCITLGVWAHLCIFHYLGVLFFSPLFRLPMISTNRIGKDPKLRISDTFPWQTWCRLLRKAGWRRYQNCTFWFENLLFEVIS